MQDLQLIGVHEDGEHLLLAGADDERFQMPVNEALRAAIRRDRPHFGRVQIEADGGLRPREVQALIRAGASTDEAANRAGWTVEKVHRYEGPILAEREHVAGLAQQARLRTHTLPSRSGVSDGGSATTLSERVVERLRERDVEVTEASWDSWRNEGGPWTVVLTFAAGGRQRQASWSFDLADRTVAAVDDEARWLSEEVQEAKGPIPAPTLNPGLGRETTVYDVEAEGGMRPSVRDERQDDPLDLMSAMRKRSTARGRRKPGGRSASVGAKAVSVPTPEKDEPAQALPLVDLEYDTEHRDTEHRDTEHRDTQPMEEAALLPAVADTSPDSSRNLTPDVAADLGESSKHEASPSAQEQMETSAREGQSKARLKRPVREATRKTGRPSVPAWDEIMFGSRPDAKRSSS